MSTRSSSRAGRGHSASSSGGGPVGGPAPAGPVPPVPVFGGGAAVPPIINAANLAAA